VTCRQFAGVLIRVKAPDPAHALLGARKGRLQLIKFRAGFPGRCIADAPELVASRGHLFFFQQRSPSTPARIRPADLLGARFVPRLLLSTLIAHDALVGSMARPCCRSWFRSWLGLWHTLLAAMFAALILHTFQIVFSGHRDQTLLFSGERL
jgi:hypothetical protein